MSLKTLPEIKCDSRIGNLKFDTRSDAMERWEPGVQAAADSDASISIYSEIGATWDGEGVTAKRISGALRAIGQKPVTVNLNSPGGDFFEGVAIYNLLRQHPEKVTVNVLGLAASAASVIAMAGDEINMGDGSFLMIHNAWAVAVGNRHDMRDAAAMLEPFDAAMVDLYAARTGQDAKHIAKLMDAETWMGQSDSIDEGFATGKLSGGVSMSADSKSTKALARVEAAMAKAGYSRSARRETLSSLFASKPGAASDAMPSAGPDAALAALLKTIQESSK